MTWTTSMIDAGATGAYISLAVDSNGYLHTAYTDADATEYILYGFYNGSWTIEEVDTGGDRFTSIALDNSEVACIAYNNGLSGGNGRIKFATRAGGTWATEDAATFAGSPAYLPCVLLFDTSNDPHIIYRNTTKSIRHAWKTGGSWADESIESWSTVYSGADQIGAVITGDTMHVCYFNDSAQLRYAVKTVGGSWSIETAFTSASVVAGANLGLDSGGDAHLFTWERVVADDHLLHVWKDGTWQSETVVADAAQTYYYGNNVAVAVNGDTFHLAFYVLDGGANNDAAYASGITGAWSVVTVIGDQGTYTYSSIAIDGSTLPVIAYSSYSATYDAMLARYSAASGNPLAMMHYKRLRTA